MSSSKLSKLFLAAGADLAAGAVLPMKKRQACSHHFEAAAARLLPSICISLTMISVV